jgi:hypothetical protein
MTNDAADFRSDWSIFNPSAPPVQINPFDGGRMIEAAPDRRNRQMPFDPVGSAFAGML